MKQFIVMIMVLTVLGCAGGQRQREQVMNGQLHLGMSKSVFSDLWGQPDKTYIKQSEDEYTKGRMGFRGVNQTKGKKPLEVWVYNKIGVELVFDGKKLVDWKTSKSREQLMIKKDSTNTDKP